MRIDPKVRGLELTAEQLQQMKKSPLVELSEACNNGACNAWAILRSLGQALEQEKVHSLKEDLNVKIIIGQVSYLLGESAGPTVETLQAWNKARKETV